MSGAREGRSRERAGGGGGRVKSKGKIAAMDGWMCLLRTGRNGKQARPSIRVDVTPQQKQKQKQRQRQRQIRVEHNRATWQVGR